MEVVSSPAGALLSTLPDFAAAVAPPTYEAKPAARQPKIPSFEMICQGLALRSGEFRSALEGFILKADIFANIDQEVWLVRHFVDQAYAELQIWEPQLTTQQANLFTGTGISLDSGHMFSRKDTPW
jgi:hypothetical protein